MKKLLRATAALVALVAGGSALAADLPVKAPIFRAPVVAVYDWTGFYVGGHGGYAWTDKEWSLPGSGRVADYTADGGIYGGQVGFNWQTGRFVIGVEVQASFGEIREGVLWTDPTPNPGSPFWIDPTPNPGTTEGGRVRSPRTGTTVEHLGTIAARLGYALDRSLIFVKGGAAWAHDVYRAFNGDRAPERLLASASDTRWGWMLGVGYEYAFLGNWSAKVEFDYLGFGEERITLVGLPGVTPATRAFDVWQDIALIKVGINYRFGGWAVAAKY